MSESAFKTAQSRFAQKDFQGAIEAIASVEEKDLFLRLVEARLAEETQELDKAESLYMDILESFSSVGAPCPLGLLHYLGFVARSRGGVEAALSLFDDLYLAESEHVTPELYPAIATAIAWNAPGDVSKTERLNRASDVFRKGLLRLKGSRKAQLVVHLAEFLALSANELKQAQLELSNSISFTKSDSVWRKWEQILVEFNADLATIKGMHAMRTGLTRTSKHSEQLVEDLGGIVTLSDQPDEAPDSWLLNTFDENEKVIKTISDKLRIDSIWPESSVLETVLGMPEKAGVVTEEEEEDLRDGGTEPTNHVYRPDVTKMLRFVPQDEMDRKVEVPQVVKNFITLLPSRNLRHANAQYIAEQCVRLLVSVTLPPRAVTEETYANVDKRTKTSYEQKYVRHIPVAVAPVLATKEKEKEEESAQKVKKEEIFDPVEYYNKK